jgi:hypothetical protein
MIINVPKFFQAGFFSGAPEKKEILLLQQQPVPGTFRYNFSRIFRCMLSWVFSVFFLGKTECKRGCLILRDFLECLPEQCGNIQKDSGSFWKISKKILMEQNFKIRNIIVGSSGNF